MTFWSTQAVSAPQTNLGRINHLREDRVLLKAIGNLK